MPKLLRWGTKSFLALSDSILKKEDIDTVHTMLRNCELACKSHEQVVLPGSTIVLNNQNDQKEEEEGKYSKPRERASRNGSTVVDISIPPPSFKLVPLSSPRSPLSKTPKHVIF